MNDTNKKAEFKEWSASSWKNLKISQQPVYKDLQLLDDIKAKISSLPPIVNHKEINLLKEKLKECHEDRSFIIQVGDCAERFVDANEEVIQRQIIFFNTLSHILAYHLKKEVIVLGRIAGQYAKPRSSPYEIVDSGEKIEVFRGDIVNEFQADSEKRVPNPERMYQAYYNSITTINQINNWNFYGEKTLDYFKKIYSSNKYQIKSNKMLQKLSEMYSNFPNELVGPVEKTNIFTSHEGLLLNYEECFLRKIEDNHYAMSSHFLWIGERTGNIEEAHIEFFRGISNPIGIKVSSRTNFDELIEIIALLNPENEKGKIVLITRFGFMNVENNLESLCKKVKKSGLEVIFVCDPNHGNTKIHEASNKKVRFFDEMKNEIIITNKILKNNGFILSGIHLEASSFHITECIGGLDDEITEIVDELYTSYCDPRLNMQQTMELCDYIGQIISSEKDEIQNKQAIYSLK